MLGLIKPLGRTLTDDHVLRFITELHVMTHSPPDVRLPDDSGRAGSVQLGENESVTLKGAARHMAGRPTRRTASAVTKSDSGAMAVATRRQHLMHRAAAGARGEDGAIILKPSDPMSYPSASGESKLESHLLRVVVLARVASHSVVLNKLITPASGLHGEGMFNRAFNVTRAGCNPTVTRGHWRTT